MKGFNHFCLDENILKNIEELGYEKPTPIQEQAIPQILADADIIASAQTGTGKTAAFMLPALNKLTNRSESKVRGPQVLVLAPTRELAMQIAAETAKYGKNLKYSKTVCIYGGVPYPIQKRSLSKHYDILVSTPGRLIDHMNQKRINLSNVKMLILDEADRMLDMGFIESVEEIAAATPKNRQTLLFSATLDKKILNISRKLQKEPTEIQIKPCHKAKKNIEQHLYFVDNINHKVKILDSILENSDIKQGIIFTSTKNQADELADDLREKGYRSTALHGDMNQRQRTRAVEKLRKGTIDLLIATDVAARGIDIPALSHVFNFDLPYHPEDFIHRIGRTGRAGAKGTAITFATYREKRWLAKIDQLTGTPLAAKTIEGLEPRSPDECKPQLRRKKPSRFFGKGPKRFSSDSKKNDSKGNFNKKANSKNSFTKRKRKAPARAFSDR